MPLYAVHAAGWECEVTMREHTCAAITASAHAAALQGGSTPNAYAAATFSQAIRAQLQVTIPYYLAFCSQ